MTQHTPCCDTNHSPAPHAQVVQQKQSLSQQVALLKPRVAAVEELQKQVEQMERQSSQRMALEQQLAVAAVATPALYSSSSMQRTSARDAWAAQAGEAAVSLQLRVVPEVSLEVAQQLAAARSSVTTLEAAVAELSDLDALRDRLVGL